MERAGLADDLPGHAVDAVTTGAAEATGGCFPKGGSSIETGASAAWAPVHDFGVGLLAAVCDFDLLTAPGVGGLAGHVIDGGILEQLDTEGDSHVAVIDGLTASTESAAIVVHGVGAGVGLARAAGRRRGWWRGLLLDGSGLWWILGLNRSRRRRVGGSRHGRGGGGGHHGLDLLHGGCCSDDCGAGLGVGVMLVEESWRRSSLWHFTVPHGGVDDDGLDDGLGLGDVGALVERSGERSGEGKGAKEHGGDDAGGLHVGWCLGLVGWVSKRRWYR
jgi:hypothetical protein